MKTLTIVCALMLVGTSNLPNSKQDYYEKREKIEREYEEDLADLAKKFVKVAERGIKTSMRSKNFDRASSWKKWESELRDRAFADPTGKYRNIAPRAKVSISINGSRKEELNNEHDERVCDLGEVSRQNPFAWAELRLRKPYLIGGVKLVVPYWRKSTGLKGPWREGRHEPFDYVVLIYNGDDLAKAVKVTDGDHPKIEQIKDKHKAVVSLFIEPTFGDRVEFKCVKVAGSYQSGGIGPILYEFEILGR